MSGWTSAEKILAIRLDAMGDVLMTEPAIRAVAESQAGPRITLLTSPAGAEVGKLLPGVDAIIAYEAPWMKTTSARASAQPDWDMLDRLRSERFDGAIVFTVYSQNPLPAALLCFLAGIPLRLAHCRENPY
ncbi:MAG TPA: hypothetical protein VKS79_13580, partial [Gemmataceae bacterium]|nr:hypothetical protein [Gemmataceae bacterium]